MRAWFDLARAEGVAEPEAAALATATPDGRPSVRMVLVRGIDADGVCFYTNRESRKGRELAANPHGAIAIHWHRSRARSGSRALSSRSPTRSPTPTSRAVHTAAG